MGWTRQNWSSSGSWEWHSIQSSPQTDREILLWWGKVLKVGSAVCGYFSCINILLFQRRRRWKVWPQQRLKTVMHSKSARAPTSISRYFSNTFFHCRLSFFSYDCFLYVHSLNLTEEIFVNKAVRWYLVLMPYLLFIWLDFGNYDFNFQGLSWRTLYGGNCMRSYNLLPCDSLHLSAKWSFSRPDTWCGKLWTIGCYIPPTNLIFNPIYFVIWEERDWRLQLNYFVNLMFSSQS